MVRCVERQVHMEGKRPPCGPGWHGGPGSGRWQPVKAPFVHRVSREGWPSKGRDRVAR